jgi:hypothetical protein
VGAFVKTVQPFPRGQILYMTFRSQGDDCDKLCVCVYSYRSGHDVLIIVVNSVFRSPLQAFD